MSNPQSKVKERFESKEKLIAAVEALMTDDLWVPRLSADRGGNKGIKQVSNRKLLRLHDVLTEVKEKFGTRAALIGKVLELEGRSKDTGYQTRLERSPVPRLYDIFKSSERRSKKAAKKA